MACHTSAHTPKPKTVSVTPTIPPTSVLASTRMGKRAKLHRSAARGIRRGRQSRYQRHDGHPVQDPLEFRLVKNAGYGAREDECSHAERGCEDGVGGGHRGVVLIVDDANGNECIRRGHFQDEFTEADENHDERDEPECPGSEQGGLNGEQQQAEGLRQQVLRSDPGSRRHRWEGDPPRFYISSNKKPLIV